MSHIVTIATRLTDPMAVAAACRRLGLAPPVQGSARLFSGTVAGLIVHLPGWRYPLAIDTDSGQVQMDHFEGRWGDPQQLDRLRQLYAVEKATREAQLRGRSVREQTLADGSIRLTISA